MGKKIIKMKELRKLFFNRLGGPIDGAIYSNDQIFEYFGISFKNKIEYGHYNNKLCNQITSIRRLCYRSPNGPLWSDFEVDGVVYHGFCSMNQREHVRNSIMRSKKRKDSANRSYNKQKRIANNLGLLDEIKKIENNKEE